MCGQTYQDLDKFDNCENCVSIIVPRRVQVEAGLCGLSAIFSRNNIKQNESSKVDSLKKFCVFISCLGAFFFLESFDGSESEWSQNRKVVDISAKTGITTAVCFQFVMKH